MRELVLRSPAVDRSANHSAVEAAAERWAEYVLSACGADSDLKTLASWAQHVAVSYNTLCANCRIVHIRPLDARDFMRVFRAVRLATACRCPPEVFLDVSDAKAIRTLSQRAGIDLDLSASTWSIQRLLSRQRFVPAGNRGLTRLRDVLLR